MRGMKNAIALVVGSVFLLAVASQFITIFIIQPIGAVPEGQTMIIWRMKSLNFIDSADAWCEREQGGVNLLCRIGVLGRVAENGQILVRLPYSEALYKFSTGGNTYTR